MKPLPFLKASIALRKVKARLPRLRGEVPRNPDLTRARKELATMLAKVTPQTAAEVRPALEAYVDTHLADLLAKMKARHETVAAELDLLAVRVTEVKELYRIHCEDQTGVLDDLEAAVSHALERVSDPDAPYYEPEPRNKRRGGNG